MRQVRLSTNPEEIMKKEVNKKKTLLGSDKEEIKIRPKDKDPLKEALNKTAVITFGRMNPPTIGHKALVDKLVQVARKEKGQPLIYLSQTQDAKKNPLSYQDKIRLAKAAFGQRLIVQSRARTIIEVMKELQRSFSSVIMVVGSDRVSEFDRLLNTYNGRDYKFESIKVVSAGTRDPDDVGVRGMSASKMRDFAAAKDLRSFEKGVPPSLKSMADMIMGMVRAGMKLEEELIKEGLGPIELDEKPLTLLQRRRRAILMKRFRNKIKVARARVSRRMADKSRLQVRARRAARRLLRQRLAGPKGKRYASLSPSEKMIIDKRVQQRANIIGKLAKRLMPRVRKAEMDRLKKMRSKGQKSHRKAAPKGAAEHYNASFELFLAEKYDFTYKMNNTQFKDMVESFLDHIDSQRTNLDEKAEANLLKKSAKYNLAFEELKQVYIDGYDNPINQLSPEQSGFNAVNEYAQAQKVDARQEKEKKSLDIRHARQDAAAKIRDIKTKKEDKELKELSTDTLVSYISKASDARGHRKLPIKKVDNRYDGVAKAGKKLDKRLSGKNEDVERRSDVKVIKKRMPDGKIKFVKAPRKEIDIGKGKYESIEEALYYKVDVEGLPIFYVSDTSPSKIRAGLRKIVKKADMIKSIDKVLPNDVRAAFRLKARKPESDMRDDSAVNEWILFERPLTDKEEKKKEEIVKALKREKPGMDDGAKYAIATAAAKKMKEANEMFEALEIGTDKIAKKYRQDTPGQTTDPDPQVIDGTPGKDGKLKKPVFLQMSEEEINSRFEFAACCDDCLNEDFSGEPEFGLYEGSEVPLDRIMMEDDGGEKKQEIGKPKRGGPKKFYVFVKTGEGKVKKVTFGDTSGLSVKMNDPEARRSFAARHKCSSQTDRTSAAYWSCRLPRYAKSLGMSGGGSFFW